MKNITTIKLNKEYKRAYFSGKYKPHPYVVTYMVRNKLGKNRIGITTSKKVGKAYMRNRSRRIIRQAYLNIRDSIDFNCGYDIVFVARDKTPSLKTQDLEKVIRKHITTMLSMQSKNVKKK